jgi:ABC-2 type transport system permease protein
MIGVIARKELAAMFHTPLAWLLLAVLQAICGYVFLVGLDGYLEKAPMLAQYPDPPGLTEVAAAPVFGTAAFLLLLATPLMSMRLIAEERRNQTLALLVSSPVSASHIVLGKFLGLFGLLALAVGLFTLMTLSLSAFTPLDYGLIAANAGGTLLVAGLCAAVGLYCSSLTAQPVVAAVSTLAALILFWVVGLGASDPSSWTRWVSMLSHYQSFANGLVNTADLLWFVLATALFLGLAVRRLDRDRIYS